MLRTRQFPPRIPRLPRPLRPPSNHVCHPRYFTTNTQLLLIASTPPVRPQLPFLHTPSSASPHPLHPSLRGAGPGSGTGGVGGPGSSGNANPLFPRALSTERRQKITQGIKVALTCYAIVVLFYVMQEGLYQRRVERLFPTPPDWPFWARWDLRCARALQAPELLGRVATDWAKVAGYYRDLLDRMEGMGGKSDGGGEDGGGEGGGDGVVVPGVGEVGFGIENMSEPWKKGYFEALMGAAETAEKLDGWVLDTKSRVVAPAEYTVGPGNPNSRPPPPGKTTRDLPQEENCVPAFESPEVFYVKILTTQGFRTNQRLDAALAYADWLDFKGLTETAGAAYEWAMDIAVSGMPAELSSSDVSAAANSQQVVDQKTAVLKSNAQSGRVTDNLLRASTAMGIHETRRGDLASALSIFLSVLRARRDLPESTPSSSSSGPHPQPHTTSEKQPSDITSSLSNFFAGPPYPIPVLTGDEQALRTHSSACEEASLMVYIGEIIFASSSPEHGLSWTRDAVDIAESTILRLQQDNIHHHSDDTSIQRQRSQEEEPSFGMKFSTPQERCQDCLKAGLDNWKTMVRKLVVHAENEELEAFDRANKDSRNPSWAPWLWSWWSRQGADEKRVQEKMQQRRRWEAEEMILKDRANTMRRLIGDQGVAAFASGTSMLLS